MVRELGVGASGLSYALWFAATNRLTITVKPDLSVTVVAPHDASPDAVDQRVQRRSAWIAKQRAAFTRLHPLPVPRAYVSGESHLYLGRQYRLRVLPGPGAVRLAPPYLEVRVLGRRTTNLVAQALFSWYHSRARQVFSRRLLAIGSSHRWLLHDQPTVRIRPMGCRWGSCGPTGIITLNPLLVMAPVSCIDYVIVHELAHRMELRHSRRFYALLNRAIPGWRAVKERLNRLPISDYASVRSASVGATRLPARTGSHIASSAATPMPTATRECVVGSTGATP